MKRLLILSLTGTFAVFSLVADKICDVLLTVCYQTEYKGAKTCLMGTLWHVVREK